MLTFVKNRFLPIALALFVALALCACSSVGGNGAQQEEAKTQIEAATYKDTSGGDFAVLTASASDFTRAGFTLGDSCDVEFENGYTLTDVPYFDGEYVDAGKPVIVAGESGVDVIIKNRNADLWTPAELYEGGDVKITLNEQGKFTDTERSNNPNFDAPKQATEEDSEDD